MDTRSKTGRFCVAFAMALATSACAHKDQNQALRPELAGVYHATRAIDAALAAGVSYGEFSGLIRDLHKELLLANDNLCFNPLANKAVATALDRYRKIADMYRDSAKIWNLEIEKKTYDPSIPIIATKYGVPEAVYKHNEMIGGTAFPQTVVRFEDIRQAIWKQAGEMHEQGISIVFGGSLPTSPTNQVENR